MSKLHIFTLAKDTNFGSIPIKAGTVLGSLQTDFVCVDPVQLLSMVNYQQVTVEVVDFTESANGEEPAVLVEASEVEIEQVVEQEQSEGGDQSESQVVCDLSSVPGLDDSLIEALTANGIDTTEKLLEFVSSGKDLTDLDKIGPTRAKKILSALNAS